MYLQEKIFDPKLESYEKEILSYKSFKFKPSKIRKIVGESPRVKSFYLEKQMKCLTRPGQFVMVWLPGHEEVPMSITDEGEDFIRISVSREGTTTSELHKLEIGSTLFLRGPFGNGFSLDGKSFLVVGGGYGVAPLIYAAKILSKNNVRCSYIQGAKTKSDLLFLDEVKNMDVELNLATDDGSEGFKGRATELMESVLDTREFDFILTCGSEQMMHRVVQLGVERSIRAQASLERYMKCGFGICGSCVLDPVGLRVCTEGPIFEGNFLLNTEFGKQKRDLSGSRVTIDDEKRK